MKVPNLVGRQIAKHCEQQGCWEGVPAPHPGLWGKSQNLKTGLISNYITSLVSLGRKLSKSIAYILRSLRVTESKPGPTDITERDPVELPTRKSSGLAPEVLDIDRGDLLQLALLPAEDLCDDDQLGLVGSH